MSVGCAFAQDVIIMKDGSTIVSKVEKITADDVTYKKYSNLKGPSYTIGVKDIKAINYENGTSDKFDSQTTLETSAGTATSNESQSPQYAESQEKKVVLIHETASSYSNDTALRKMYYDMNDWQTYEKKAKKLKIVGWTVGPVLFAAGLISTVSAFCRDYDYDYDNWAILLGTGTVLMAGGVATTAGCLIKSNQYMKKSKSLMSSAPIWQYNLNCGNGTNLALSVNTIHSAYTRDHTLGLGLKYSF